MPSYRGISQKEIVESLTDAVDFLDKNPLGPETQKRVDQIRAKLPALALAKSDLAFKNAIADSGANWLFLRTTDVWKYHAAANTDNQGRDIFERLNKWGIFDGFMTLESNAVDGEQKAWLAARNIPTGLNNYAAPSLFKTYGIAVDDLTSGKINIHDPSLTPLRKKIELALQPFYASGEVMYTGIGAVTLKYDPSNQQKPFSGDLGVIFSATARAAQAVANALPDQKLIDEHGNVIAPEQHKTSKKSSPKPIK